MSLFSKIIKEEESFNQQQFEGKSKNLIIPDVPEEAKPPRRSKMPEVKEFDLNLDYHLEDCVSEEYGHGQDNYDDYVTSENISLAATSLEDQNGFDAYIQLVGDESHDDKNRNQIGQDGSGDVDVVAPCKGMVFTTVKEFFTHCHYFAKFVGFQMKIRSSEKKRKGAAVNPSACVITKRNKQDYNNCGRLRLECSKSGKFESKSKDPAKPTSTNVTGCKFKVNASVNDDGSWRLTKVELAHNHLCTPEDQNRYRHIGPFNENMILNNYRAGVPTPKNSNSCVVHYGGHNNVPFMERDCRNLNSEERGLGLEDGDYAAMRRYFEEMISSNSNFFYKHDTYEDGTLRNVFWADGRSRAAYQDFGDVLSFDATYVRNRYRMPFAPFIGVNNHGQSILFGCALVGGESETNYAWIFETLLTCMSNKKPKAILTDQCQAIGNAITTVFPDTPHRWCIWHVIQNAKKHLHKHPAGWDDVSKGLKEALHGSNSISEFEDSWKEWIKKFGLQNIKWCNDMYRDRDKWVPVYSKDHFWGGMSSTDRSESMNNFFKGFVNLDTTLKQFVEQYRFVLAKRVSEEDQATIRSVDAPMKCETDHVFEIVFQKLYTNSKFSEFQTEVTNMGYANAVKLGDDGSSCFYEIVVRRFLHGVTRRAIYKVKVERESLEIKCECKNFEFRGILCTHSLCVFREEELEFVPKRYIVDRWRKDIPREHLKIPVPYYSLLKRKPKEMERYTSVQNSFEPIASLTMNDDGFYKEVMDALS